MSAPLTNGELTSGALVRSAAPDLFHVEQPEWLLILLLIIPIAWTGLRWLSTMSIPRRVSAVLARTALLVLVAAALSGASLVGRADRLAMVVVADLSGSVGDARAQARTIVERLDPARGPDDLLGVVVFDGRAAIVSMPTTGTVAERSWELLASDGTDIERALRLASSVVPSGADGRILLVSDGLQTSGDALGAASELASRGIRVDAVALSLATGPEVIVERVDLPSRAAAGATVTARVHLRSTDGARGVLRVSADGRTASSRRIEPGPGSSIWLAEFSLRAGRVHDVEAVFEPDEESGGDTVVSNNRATASVLTPGAGSVLIVDGVGGGNESASGATLLKPLRDAGLEVRMIAPEATPTDLVALDAFDLVILQNVGASAMPEGASEALASGVRDLGIGLVMIGGPSSFGAGGHRGSELEPILPVLLDLPDRIVVPEAAIVFVLDTSGSMRRAVLGSSRTQQEVANEAAALAVRSLDRTDLVGVIGFSDRPSVLVPLGPNRDPDGSAERVLAISPDGGTDVREALALAGRQLREAEAKVKHVVVLSDGQSRGAELLPEMAAALALEGVQVSTIAVGDGADVGTMREMAERGGGVFYNVLNPTRLPRVFLKVVEVVRSPLVREGRFRPVVTASGSPLTQGLGQTPDLLGLVLTRARTDATATLAMATAEGEPVLAHWPVELGRVAAFTSDAERWASEWIEWEGFAPFWVRVARVIGRSQSASPMELTLAASGSGITVMLDAIAPDGAPIEGLDATATVYRQGDSRAQPSRAALRQVGPGRYEASIGAEPGASYVVLVGARQGERAIAPVMGVVSAPSGLERSRFGADPVLLERIARATGGAIVDAEGVEAAWAFDRSGLPARRVLRPLWRELLPWILCVMLLDVGTRRVAWDRLVSERFGDGLRRRARDATEARGEGSARTLGSLRAAKGGASASMGGAALSEQDAARVRREQEAKRMLSRVEEARGSAAPVSGDAGTKPSGGGEEPSGLLAAKRRARERMERDGA